MFTFHIKDNICLGAIYNVYLLIYIVFILWSPEYVARFIVYGFCTDLQFKDTLFALFKREAKMASCGIKSTEQCSTSDFNTERALVLAA